jgi:hypothetical protein
MAKRKKKRFENLPLRERYRESVGERCELTGLLPDDAQEAVEKARPKPWYPQYIVHHIIHPFQQRRDLPSNLIVIDDIVHKWGHNSYPIELTIMCLWRKWDKGEFNKDELSECLGSSIIAWLEWKGMANVGRDSDYYRMCLEMREMN